jgi:hypothetical protein
MDEKTHEKESKKQVKAIDEFRSSRSQADAETHIYGKTTWKYDPKTGNLVKDKGRK